MYAKLLYPLLLTVVIQAIASLVEPGRALVSGKVNTREEIDSVANKIWGDECVAWGSPVDLNIDTLFKSQVNLLKAQAIIVPSIFKINMEHSRSYKHYEIPFDTIAKATGLALIFGKILPDCCDCTAGKDCASDFRFEKTPGSPCATFSWQNRSGKGIFRRNSVGDYFFEVNIPPILKGRAQVAPNLLRFIFQGDGLSIKIVNKLTGKIILGYGISYIESSAWSAVICPFKAGPYRIPQIPLFIEGI